MALIMKAMVPICIEMPSHSFSAVAMTSDRPVRAAARSVGGHDAADPAERVEKHADRHDEVLFHSFEYDFQSAIFHFY